MFGEFPFRLHALYGQHGPSSFTHFCESHVVDPDEEYDAWAMLGSFTATRRTRSTPVLVLAASLSTCSQDVCAELEK